MIARIICIAAALGLAAAGRAAEPCSFRVAALVQAGPARWMEIPGDAVISRSAPDKFRRPFLESGAGIPVRAPAVMQALAAALAPLTVSDRMNVRKVLDAIGGWAAATLVEDLGPVPCPAGWRDAARVLTDRQGNPFELARALTAVIRAAGLPARPTYNGVPAVAVFIKPREGPGAWTIVDPFHPMASTRRLPVAWLPLRGGDLPPVSFSPNPGGCGPLIIEVRRYVDRDAAARDVEAVRTTGAFLPMPPPPLRADAPAWWEAWSIGAALEPPAGRWSAVVALPYVRELDYGTRDHAVWVSDPARMPAVTMPLSETDGAAGGIVMSIKLVFPPALR